MHLVMVEALTSGAGFDVAQVAIEQGARVTFLSSNPVRYRKLMSERVRSALDIRTTRTDNTPDLLAAIQTASTIEPVRGLIGMTDGAIENVAEAAEHLQLPFCPTAGVRNARNKDRTRQICSETGVPIPGFAVIHTEEQMLERVHRFGLPCILKGSRGTGGAQVVLCETQSDCKHSFRRLKEESERQGGVVLVEQFVTGPMFSCETLADSSGIRVLGFTDRVKGPLPNFTENALAFPVVIPAAQAKQIGDLVCSLLGRMGVTYG